MSDHINDLAGKVVEAFKDELSDSTKEAITSQELEYLHELVIEALSMHAASIADELRRVINKLKGEIEKPEIGL